MLSPHTTATPMAAHERRPSHAPQPRDQMVPRAFAFSDLVGSTMLAERLGDRRFAALIREHNALVRGALAGRGEEAHFLGDGFMVAFPTAAGAVEWAVRIQHAMAVLRRRTGLPLLLRIGAHAGTAVREGATWLGRDVIIARRLCEQAEPGEILVTRELREQAGEGALAMVRAVELRGLAAPTQAFRLPW